MPTRLSLLLSSYVGSPRKKGGVGISLFRFMILSDLSIGPERGVLCRQQVDADQVVSAALFVCRVTPEERRSRDLALPFHDLIRSQHRPGTRRTVSPAGRCRPGCLCCSLRMSGHPGRKEESGSRSSVS